MNPDREKWHRLTTVKENIGAKNTQRLISFVCPGLNVKCEYPPRKIKADVVAIKLRSSFDSLKDKPYETFEDFMISLKMFVPYEKYEESGIFTNFYYEKWVYAASLELIIGK